MAVATISKFDKLMVVLNAIKAAGSNGINRSDLIGKTSESLGVGYGSIDLYVQELCEKGKVRKQKLGPSKFSGVKYIFIDPSVKIEKSKKETTAVDETVKTTDHVDDLSGRYGETRNNEGYPDPTASSAVGSNDMPVRGEIWSRSTANGETHDFLVIASNGSFVTGIQLKDVTYYLSDTELEHHFESKRGKTYYYDPVRLTTVPVKYFKETMQSTSKEEYSKVISEINRYLGFVAAEPKTVEVVKEVPVEVVKEVEVPVGDSEEIDRLKSQVRVLEAKISVYKECIQAFGNK